MQSETQEAGDLDKDSKRGAGARLVQQPLREPLPQVRQVGVLFEASDERVEVPLEVGLLAVRGLRESSVEHLGIATLGREGDKGESARKEGAAEGGFGSIGAHRQSL